ncbi:L-serine ammonia-lyase, iron-sulfur-dependent subunit beta [Peptoniphilus catoniae]|uniref:L-serine ammonia-lyase, iron-sulfur-dependent subunit beta n=1 Tax=Peptoniphilus catoniae TaxID=1660341 RepID=UPI0010FD9C12|nr:L-serine ammonia-lyase, iron-sulfur-dependent subunit beta [Peptoniphilus catoniae]
MADYNMLDILGPVMVGPSSSHTAGACRIANVALKICGEDFEKVEFILHGSFAATYKGHGTDKALIGGIMGFSTYDDRLRRSFEIAEKKKLNYIFKTENLGEAYHPNTVKINFFYKDRQEYIIGSSIGGGAIEIVNINGVSLSFRGEFPVILLQYHEQKGVIAYVSSLLFGRNYNIESMNTDKDNISNIVTLTIELDQPLAEDLKSEILESERFIFAKYVEV